MGSEDPIPNRTLLHRPIRRRAVLDTIVKTFKFLLPGGRGRRGVVTAERLARSVNNAGQDEPQSSAGQATRGVPLSANDISNALQRIRDE